MPRPRFLQVHTLTSYPAALLNRDDAGLAKRLPYGGTVRTRISSQSLKRHWRLAQDDFALREIPTLSSADFAMRSRRHFSDQIALPLLEEGHAEPDVVEIVGLLSSRVLKGGTEADAGFGDTGETDKRSGKATTNPGSKKGGDGPAVAASVDRLETNQAFLLTSNEVAFLIDQARRILGGDEALRRALDEKPKKGSLTPYQAEARKNLAALGGGARVARSLDASLFGRMVTSDVFANTDAAMHVAHAFTVHQQESETDYFTVVDDLKALGGAEDAGSAGIFDTELTSGLYYGYVVVDVPLLVANLTGVKSERWHEAAIDRELAGKVVEHLLHLIATVSPGAKKGSTAPYAHAQTMLVEAGTRQPRTLASAFEAAITAPKGHSMSELAEDALFRRLEAFDRAYGARETRRFLSLAAGERVNATGPQSLDDLAAWAGGCVKVAEA